MMKKGFFVFLAGVMALSLFAGCSKGYVAQKNADNMTITLKAARYPLVKGDNDLSVSLADASGKSVTDAAVQVRYYMPAMPGMAPMDFSATALARGGAYGFVANVPMEGGWKVEVTATPPGKPAVTATFNVDAR